MSISEQSDAGADENLGANNTIATEETWSEDADSVGGVTESS